MKTNFELRNILGTVYKQGTILFTRDGNAILSPVGNRVNVYNLVTYCPPLFLYS